ncbi:helix-turn-helix transcriptional regulator [uncultured Marinococcus sp.]|uniref:helix-turn-helix domain-containing protein n=1 Tax=uncultured Marinococcus sp. TaxID=487012 RepID=UPI00261A84ED|nr:helix-turn-helix transcriptional regulator [uncultured Marinococcus sp.]
MGARISHSSWEKLFQLGESQEETDQAYAKMLETAMEIRVELGLTQAMLAEKSGLTSSMISKMESGNNHPTMKTFLKYLRGLEIDWALMQKK